MVELVKATDVFEEAKALLEGVSLDGGPVDVDLDRSEALLNELLDNNPGNITIIYVLGTLHLAKRNNGLAIQLLAQTVRINPTFGEAWNNLALAYRGANDHDRAVVCCKKAFKYIQHPDIPTNISGLFLCRHKPDEALEWANIALEIKDDHPKALWHKATALLELRRWEEAWPLHESRLLGGANYNIALRNYHGKDEMTPWWDGKTSTVGPRKAFVVIHGEQGMGDEIMFSSCIQEAIDTGANILLEPSPRLDGLFKRAFPGAKVYSTNDPDGNAWIKKLGKPDFKCAVGSLPKFYRNSDKDFPGTPFLKPDPERKRFWGEKLRALGNKPKIGLAWQGGVQSTRYDARSFHPQEYAPLFQHDVDWISLQYDETAQRNIDEVAQAGMHITHWPEAVAAIDPETGKQSNLEELAALISNLDLVISVCQTTIHFAGALGIPCLCLTPSQPSWRYSAVESEVMPWYDSVTLIRQEVDSSDWGPVIADVEGRLRQFLAELEAVA